MIGFIRRLLGKFVKSCLIKDAGLDLKAITSIQYEDVENQLNDNSIFVGNMTRRNLTALLDEGSTSEHCYNQFYKAVRAFYVKSLDYIKETFPLDDDIIKHAKLANFQLRDGMDFSYVTFFVERYANILKFSDKDIDLLHDELVDYIILEDTDIPQSVWEEAALQENDDDENVKRIRMDTIVAHLSRMTAPGSNSLRFPRLSRVLQLIMIIPHSNADEERVFSLIRKNKTCFRPNLDPDITLQNLIMVKLAIPKPCQDYEPDGSVLSQAKKATWIYNKAHKN